MRDEMALRRWRGIRKVEQIQLGDFRRDIENLDRTASPGKGLDLRRWLLWAARVVGDT
jgi:hypothetical protein